MEVETTSYDDDGTVNAETVITLEETEVVVVEFGHTDEHRVWEREPGDTEPTERIA